LINHRGVVESERYAKMGIHAPCNIDYLSQNRQ
jgi:hypothetical protein